MLRFGQTILLLGLVHLLLIALSPSRCYPGPPLADNPFPTLEQQLVSSIGAGTALAEAKRLLSGYLIADDPEMRKGFELILQEDIYSFLSGKNNIQTNYALALLVYLLENGAFLPGDTMTIALALANNYIYSIADEQTRRQIKKDIIKHFAYYKGILAWQKSLNISYDLARSPVIPKVYWAHRQRNLDLFRAITSLHLDQYLEFVDTIENLELMHSILRKNRLARADSLIALARNIEQFTEKNLLYRATIDQHKNKLKAHPDDKNAQQAVGEYEKGQYTSEFMGKKRRWDLFYWLNHQAEVYKKYGYFKGDCVTETTFQMNLYKAAGIPAMANQVRPVLQGGFSHNSPLFYNLFFNKWDSIQFPREGDAEYYVHFEKPVWHHLRYEKDGGKYKRKGREVFSSYWQGEKTDRENIVQFRDRGFTEDHLEQLFLSDTTQQPGTIFNRTSAPDSIPDTDNDSIADEFETAFSTDPSAADTDQDGFADLWEIEWGFNPTDRSSHPQDDTVAVDGLAAREIRILQPAAVKDPAADYKADREIFDIASFSARLFEKNIYLAITYHNDIRKNSRDIHTVRITAEKKGGLKRQIALQWVRGKIHLYKVTAKDWIKQECNQQDFAISTVKDTEMTIPLSLFDRSETLQISYQATGIVGNKSTNNSDSSEQLTVDLTKSASS